MESFALVVVGITSNLAQIKLIPALYDMVADGSLPENISIIGVARKKMSKEEFNNYFKEVLNTKNIHHQHEIKPAVFEKLCSRIRYIDGSVEDGSIFPKLEEVMGEESKDGTNCNNRMYYLATYPNLYQKIFDGLKDFGLDREDCGWVRILIEKPIGSDLESSRKLNKLLDSYFNESQIYRLDHYLGKETIQNILTFRFGNGIFKPLINKDYVDHIQITAAESYGIGKRGSYYDTAGALIDVGQNHLLQMLAFATMESPGQFTNEAVTRERINLIESLKPQPQSLVLGQYGGYLNEINVSQGSKTDTYFAFKTEIKNEKFSGVPIYIRAGKKLAQTVTEISIVFKTPNDRLFKHLDCGMEPNVLVYRVQPNEGIILKILAKNPGHEIKLTPSFMQFCYKHLPNESIDPYEHLIYDAMVGDQTFFNDAAEVEAQWKFIDALGASGREVLTYASDSWGPKEADEMIEFDGRHWLEPSMDFCNL